MSGELEEFRLELWATATTWTLHAKPDCCVFGVAAQHSRKQVRDHSDPSYFDLDRFALCPFARRALTEKGSRDG